MAPPIATEAATEIDVWLAPNVTKECDDCGKRIHMREVVDGGHWCAFDRVSINHIHEHNGRLLGAALLSARHRCEPKAKE